MKLPAGHQADLGSKLEDYVLNPNHRDGKHKARVFKSVLGITLENRGVLTSAILAAATNSDAVQARGNNGHGDVYILSFPLQTKKGTATIMTGWIIRHGESFLRLTTCYIM
ncbi:MAG TPA: hypothetical protein VG722_12340 [Tepidisphaeraceae bacterium]|nr:hypothetical protein [Tepidisphaeraceae bacterium]